MADFAVQRKKISNGNGLKSKGEVFGSGPQKFRVDDYSEIFGSYHSSKASSIPILDLPAVEEDAAALVDVRCSELDYSEVFGGFDCVDFAVPYEELFLDAREEGGETSSEEAWTPAETGSPSEGSSEELLCSEDNQTQAYDDVKQFSMSYHKINQTSKEDGIGGTTHIAHLNAVPAFTYIVDEDIPSQKKKSDKPPSMDAIEDYWKGNSNGGVMEGEHFQKAGPEEPACDHVSRTSGYVNSNGVMEGKNIQKTMSDKPASDAVSRTSRSVNGNGEKEGKLLQETELDKPACDIISKISRSVNPNGVTEEKQFQDTMSDDPADAAVSKISRSVNSNGIIGDQFQKTMPAEPACHSKTSERNPSGNGNYFSESFLTIAEINLKTQPCHVPPPSRPPPKIAIKQGDSRTWIASNNKAAANYVREGATSDATPPFFDVEVDASSSAAASAAAMKEAMEKAQATLKSAKVSMERKRDGLQNRKKLGLKDDLKGKQRREGAILDESIIKENKFLDHLEREGSQMKGYDTEERQRATEATQVAPDFEATARASEDSQDSLDQKRMREHISTQKFPKLKEGPGKWNEEEKFYELVKKDKFEMLAEAPVQNKRERKLEHIEVYKDKLNEKTSGKGDFKQQEENDGTPYVAVVKGQLEEGGKKLKVGKEASEWEGYGKKLKEGQDLEESDKKLREDFEPKEHEKNHRDVCERQKQEKQLKEISQMEKNETRLKEAHEIEEYTKLKEAQQREEYEKKLQESRQQKENEMKENEAREKEETEKRQKEKFEREENEKRLKEECERQKKEKWLKEVYEHEEYEKKLREVQELQENKMRQKRACEENENRLREAYEMEEKVKRQKEAFEQEKNVKLQKEACEREENEKRLRELQEQKENEMRKEEDLEMKENEKKLKEFHEREETTKKENEAHEREENKKRQQEDIERTEHEKVSVSQEGHVCKQQEQNLKTVKSFQGVAESEKTSTSSNGRSTEDEDTYCKATGGDCEVENNEKLKVVQESWGHKDNGKMMEGVEFALEAKENEELKVASQQDVRLTEACVARRSPEHEVHENIKEGTSLNSLYLDDKKPVELEEAVGQENYEKCKKADRVVLDWEGKKIKLKEDQGLSKAVENEKKMEATLLTNALEEKSDKLKASNDFNATEKKEEMLSGILKREEREKEKKLQRERVQEKDRIRKFDEDRERAREREKDRMAVERATREVRERAYAEARERAERAAVERATAEVRQRALAEARERLEKASAEAREKSLAERASVEARLRAERAAVDRATAEARERAVEKAMAEKAAFEARERVDRSVSEKFSASSRDNVMRQSASFSDLRDSQFQSASSFNSSQRYANSSNHGAFTTEKSQGSEVESAQRCKARLERHQRTVERAAKALAEKNKRDFLALREQAERNRLSETLDADVKRWSSGKEGNLRALLSTLQYILGPDSGWQPIPLTDVITAVAAKKAYRKATLCVHPDKLQQRGASIHQKYICEKVFDLLKEAWNKFNSEER